MSRGFDQRSGEGSIYDSLVEAIRAGIVEVHTALPGEIVNFDATTQTASVQLCIQREVVDSTDTITQLDEVPVMIQCGGGFSVTFPLTAGDPCLILFIERGLDNWYLDGGCQAPETRRHHHYSDAICLPGLRPAPSALANYDATNLTIRTDDGQTQLCITPNGEFALTNGTEELLTIVRDLIQALEGVQTLVASGSSAGQHGLAPADIADLAAIRGRIETLIK